MIPPDASIGARDAQFGDPALSEVFVSEVVASPDEAPEGESVF